MLYYLFTGITLGLSAGVSPGPLMALVLSETISYGKRAGVYVAVAPLITDIPIVILSLYLVSSLSDSSLAFGLLSVIGGIYLLWLSRENFDARELKVIATPKSQSLKKGIIANFLNPAPYLFWISIGAPTFVKGWENQPANSILFIGGFYVCLIGSKSLIAYLLGTYRARLKNTIYRLINILLGMILVLLALKFIYDGYYYLSQANIF